MSYRFCALLSIASLFLAACGGAQGGAQGGVEPPVVDPMVAIPVNPDLQGYANSGGMAGTNDQYMWLGDDSSNVTHRGFLGFDLPAIAPELIKSAHLSVYQSGVEWGYPYTDLGALVLDHMDLGGTIDNADYPYSAALEHSVAVLAIAYGEDEQLADVTETVKKALTMGLSTVDFRLRFPKASDNDNAVDLTFMNGTADPATSGVLPTLIITYHP